MAEPRTQQEYETRYFRNLRITGFGIHGVTNHFPCPFCGAADWYSVRVIDFGPPAEPGRYTDDPHVCEECRRSARHVIVREDDGTIVMSMEQIDGADPPPWVPIHRGRLEEES
jgi:hypothetical protein